MSNDLLELKYRPKSLGEYWGNEELKERVIKLAESNSIPNNIIISGDVGIGKSSLAYILTKLVLCQNRESTHLACEECSSCLEINNMYNTGQSRKADVKRLSLSNFNNDTKLYLENIVMSITAKKEKPRVYFIDELQMISLLEQEKLNDVTEYVNPNSYVIITTSNIGSIAKSILTRFAHFEVSNPSLEEQISRVSQICSDEHIDLNKKQIKDLVINSNYNPRTVLKNLTDISKCGSSHFYSLIRDNDEETKICIEYFNAVRSGIFGLIDFLESHEDIKRVYYALPSFLYKLFVVKYNRSNINPNYVQAINEINKLYKEAILIEVIDSIDTKYTYSKDRIKSLLLSIGYKIDNSLYNQLSEEDSTTNLISKGSNDLTADTNQQADKKVTSNSLQNFATIQFDTNKETGMTLDDL